MVLLPIVNQRFGRGLLPLYLQNVDWWAASERYSECVCGSSTFWWNGHASLSISWPKERANPSTFECAEFVVYVCMHGGNGDHFLVYTPWPLARGSCCLVVVHHYLHWPSFAESLAARVPANPSVAAILMYTTWHIWRERYRRIYEHSTLRPDQVFGLIQNNVLMRRKACGNPLLQEELLVV